MTNIETRVFAIRINKSNIEQITKDLKRGKMPADYYHTTEGKRELREGDFVVITESVVELMKDVELEGFSSWSPIGVFSKSQFKKHFGRPVQIEGRYTLVDEMWVVG